MVFGGEAKLYTSLLFVITSVFTLLALTGHLDLTGGIFFLQGFLVYVACIGWGIYEGILSPPTNRDNLVRGEEPARGEPSESFPLLPNASTNTPRIGQGIKGILNNMFRVLIGLIALSISSFVMSHCTSALATNFNISATLFGATVLSLGTAFLPKLIRRVQSGVPPGKATVIASTTASNIFLLTICMGVILVTNPDGDKTVAATIIPFEIWSAWVSSIVLMFIVWIWGRPWMGGLLLGLYASFIGAEFLSYRR
jgi:Ca2+/Na+ antiporter